MPSQYGHRSIPDNARDESRSDNTADTADILARRRAFLEISDRDLEQVRALAGFFGSFLDEFVDDFYRHLFSTPVTASFLTDPVLVSRLKESQKRYFESLLQARLNADYVADRRRIGRAHAEVGIEPEWFLGAYNQYLQFALRKFAAQSGADQTQYVEGTLALLKVILLDTGLTLDAYFAQSTEQLRTALRMLAQSNSELKEFASLASHDLKSPLGAVAGLCEEFLDEFGSQVPEQGRKLIEAAQLRALGLGRMISDLLAMSEASAQPHQRARVATRRLIDEVLERLRPELEGRAIEIVVPDHVPDVNTHPGRFHEALYQVMSNAVKFMGKDRGLIELTVETNKNEHVFCVRDTGPGIAEADIPQIFAPFRRLPQHRFTPGSGLGLYFVKTFVEGQGGRVWVASLLGESTQFYLALPIIS
jgi:signal transduction histidine kinase